jgi:hypothetical protein
MAKLRKKRSNRVVVFAGVSGPTLGQIMAQREGDTICTLKLICSSGEHDRYAFVAFSIENKRKKLNISVTPTRIDVQEIPLPRKRIKT